MTRLSGQDSVSMKHSPSKKQPFVLYTIGYATKSIEEFIRQLKHYSVDVVADVRSVPYSKVFHVYHKESIAGHLNASNIQYVYLGEELGPRSKDNSHYDESNQVVFDRLMQSGLFQQGVNRLHTGSQKGFSIALMCAEKDPATCHRSLLIGYFLQHHTSPFGSDCEISHIRHDGSLETQQELEARLPEMNDVKVDMFMSAKEQARQAYEIQLKKTSYRKEE